MRTKVANRNCIKINNVYFADNFTYCYTSEILEVIEKKFGECYNIKFIEDLRDAFTETIRNEGLVKIRDIINDIKTEIDKTDLFKNLTFYHNEGRSNFQSMYCNMIDCEYEK